MRDQRLCPAAGLELLSRLVLQGAAGGVTPGPIPRHTQWPSSRGVASGAPAPGGPAADAEQARLTALVELARGGDREAYAEIYDRYVSSIYRYVYYRLGSHALAEDLTSETFLRALRGLGGFRWQGRDIGAWFTTIARNLVNDHLKSSRFRLEVTTADLLEMDRADGGVEEAVLARLESRRLVEAVRRLRSDQQECIVLRFLQGLSVVETADVMGRSQGAVKQLQFRAVRNLAQQLAVGGADDVTGGGAARWDGHGAAAQRRPAGMRRAGRRPR